MASTRRKPVKKYKFELTLSGVGGIGVVCFCIFLWMFLLGVWTGQSLLMPSSFDKGKVVQGDKTAVVDLNDQKKHKPK